MRFKMRENSIFAVLLRSPWYVSAGLAVVLGLAARLAMPDQFSWYAYFAGGPFIVIACITGWRQFFAMSKSRAGEILDAVGAMSLAQFSAALEQAFQREGYVVTRLAGPAADFRIELDGKAALVNCKRWKAAKLGVEPLRELQAAAQSSAAQGRTFITIGEVSDTARRFATQNDIDVLEGMRLAQLLRDLPSRKQATA